jgi:hypothetical protein
VRFVKWLRSRAATLIGFSWRGGAGGAGGKAPWDWPHGDKPQAQLVGAWEWGRVTGARGRALAAGAAKAQGGDVRGGDLRRGRAARVRGATGTFVGARNGARQGTQRWLCVRAQGEGAR